MEQKYLFAIIFLYFAVFTHQNAHAHEFKYDQYSVSKAFDSLRTSLEVFRNVFENKFNTFFKWSRGPLVRKNANASTIKTNSIYESNACKCVNFTCSCCAHVEIKKFNISDTGFYYFT